GIVKVELERRSGTVELHRPDAKVGTLTQPGQPARRVALQRRSVRDCLTEELRRLDPDEIYEATLKGLGKIVTGRATTSNGSAADLYWGDERFLPAGDPERNETQAREALLDHVPVPPERVHVMAPSDGAYGDDPDAAAAAYADVLSAAARPEDHAAVPTFDVCLLGIGGEGHVASVFPSSP